MFIEGKDGHPVSAIKFLGPALVSQRGGHCAIAYRSRTIHRNASLQGQNLTVTGRIACTAT